MRLAPPHTPVRHLRSPLFGTCPDAPNRFHGAESEDKGQSQLASSNELMIDGTLTGPGFSSTPSRVGCMPACFLSPETWHPQEHLIEAQPGSAPSSVGSRTDDRTEDCQVTMGIDWVQGLTGARVCCQAHVFGLTGSWSRKCALVWWWREVCVWGGDTLCCAQMSLLAGRGCGPKVQQCLSPPAHGVGAGP